MVYQLCTIFGCLKKNRGRHSISQKQEKRKGAYCYTDSPVHTEHKESLCYGLQAQRKDGTDGLLYMSVQNSSSKYRTEKSC